MLLKLFLAFTITPFLEIYLLIKIGSYVGAFNTLMIVILTGFLGALYEIVESGRTPAEEKLEKFDGVWDGEIDHLFKEYAY